MNVELALKAILGDLGVYSRALLPNYALREYQLEAAGPGKWLR